MSRSVHLQHSSGLGILEVAQRARELGMDCRDAGYVDRLEAERDRYRDALSTVRLVASRFMDRGHAGFEYEEVSEALAIALQELSLIRRSAARALGTTEAPDA